MRYTKESKIHWSGFSSVSASTTVGQAFGSGPGVVFKLDVQNAKDIRPFSWFGAEQELLLSPNVEFLVTKEQYTPTEGMLSGCNVIEMQQIPSDTLWS